MSTVQFSLQDFVAALPKQAHEVPDPYGTEHCFKIDFPDGCYIAIRSSIHTNGLAAGTGKDSIRFYLINLDGDFVASIDKWTTREPGWEHRVQDKISEMAGLWSQVRTCKVCGKQMPIKRSGPNSKHPGKLFTSCSMQCNQFAWIDEQKRVVLDEVLAPAPLVDLSKIDPFEEELKPIHKPQSVLVADFSRLNVEQLAVVNRLAQFIEMLDAGAGSGKTTVMTNLLVNMIISGQNPGRLLAVTFSVKAAAEMRVRLAKLFWPGMSERELKFFEDPRIDGVDENSDQIVLDRSWVEADPLRQFLVDWVCTIHAMSLRLLKASGHRVNTISRRQQWEVDQILKDALDQFKWKVSLKNVKAYIGYAIESLIEDNEALDLYREILAQYSDVDPNAPAYLADMYSRYMRYMRKNHLVDFSMMQCNLLKEIRGNPSFADTLANMFDAVVVDEFQDTDDMQAEIIETLVSKSHRLVGVGDPWQCLYRFRGAKPELMETEIFEMFPKAIRSTLPTNYRSTGNIVKSTNRLIGFSYVRREHLMKSMRPRETIGDGDPITYQGYGKFSDMVAGVIELISSKGEPKDWYVLSRTRAEGAAIHLGLVSAKIPAINLAGGSLMGASHIRKVLAYAKLACNYHGARDDVDTVSEIANVASSEFLAPFTRRNHDQDCPDREKGWATKCSCPVIAREDRDSSAVRFYGAKAVEAAGNWQGIVDQQYETIKGGNPSMRSKGARDLVQFVEYLETLRDDAMLCLRAIIDESVMPFLAHEEGIDESDLTEDGRQEDFNVLTNLIEDNKMKLERFLDKIEELTQKQDADTGSVHVGTVHKVKGLQRPYVIVNLTRCPITPPARKKGELPVGVPNSIQDERNIAYVGMTRAELCCHLVTSAEWDGKQIPTSQFVQETIGNIQGE